MLHINNFFVSVIFVVSFFAIIIMHNSKSYKVQNDLSNCVIRFHVKANSDTIPDQNLKLKVKDNVVGYMNQHSSEFTSLEDAKQFIASHDKDLKEIANTVIKNNGYDYAISSSFGLDDFPVKKYGDMSFPSGTYLSYTMYIGSGEGHNWWCVLYPPLCFVDASSGILPESSKEIIKENISEEDYSYISEDNTVFRFKYLTFLNKLFK